MKKSPYKLGLTGSIGMGKSTTAAMFVEQGVPVWDADSAVATLYLAGGAGAKAIAKLVPDAVDETGVNRPKLRAAIQADNALLGQIEAVIHPLMFADRQAFFAKHQNDDIILFDLPLLFETGAENWMDGVLVVSASPEIQRERVLARPGMTPEFYENILSRQVPDAEKRAKADWVIDTSHGLDAARQQVLALLSELRESRRHA